MSYNSNLNRVEEGVPLISSDGGQTWVRRTAARQAVRSAWSSVACSSDGRVLAASVAFTDYHTTYNGPSIHMSWDFGNTWRGLDIYGGPVAISSDGTKILVAQTGGGTMHTTDIAWQPTPMPTPPPTQAPTR